MGYYISVAPYYVVKSYDLNLNEILNYNLQNLNIAEVQGVSSWYNNRSFVNIAANDNNELSLLYVKDIDNTLNFKWVIRSFNSSGQLSNSYEELIQLSVGGAGASMIVENFEMNNLGDIIIGAFSPIQVDNLILPHLYKVYSHNTTTFLNEVYVIDFSFSMNELDEDAIGTHILNAYSYELEFLDKNSDGYYLTYSEQAVNIAPQIPIQGEEPPADDFIVTYKNNYKLITFDETIVVNEFELNKVEFEGYDGTGTFNYEATGTNVYIVAETDKYISSECTPDGQYVHVSINTDYGYFSGLVNPLTGEYIDEKFHQGVIGRNKLNTHCFSPCQSLTTAFTFGADETGHYPMECTANTNSFVASFYQFKTISTAPAAFDYVDGDIITSSLNAVTKTFNGRVYIKNSIEFVDCNFYFAPNARLVIVNENTNPETTPVMITSLNTNYDVIAACENKQMWKGIEVAKYCIFSATGGSLANAQFGISNITTKPQQFDETFLLWQCSKELDDLDYSINRIGGKINCRGVHFLNNYISMYFDNLSYPMYQVIHEIQDCNFIQNANLQDPITMQGTKRRAFIVCNATRTVKVSNNLFYDAQGFIPLSAATTINNHSNGIEICNAPMHIFGTNAIGNQFINNKFAIFYSTPFPEAWANLKITNNSFSYNDVDIALYGGVDFLIEDNTFINNTTKPGKRRSIVGNGAKKIMLNQNNFNTYGNAIYVNNTDGKVSYPSKILNNTISNNGSGISEWGKNMRLGINCNLFSGQIKTHWYHSSTLQDQGVCLKSPARNRFTTDPSHNDIYSNTNSDELLSFQYNFVNSSNYSITDVYPISDNTIVDKIPCDPLSQGNTNITCDKIQGIILSATEADAFKIKIDSAIVANSMDSVRLWIGDVLSYYSEREQLDSAIRFLYDLAYTPAKIILAQLTAQKGKYENALEILNSLSEDTLVTSEELEYLIACNKIVSRPQQMDELLNNYSETLIALSDVVYKDYTDISASTEALLYQINITRFNIWEEIYDENTRKSEHESLINNFSVYPNPASSAITILSNGSDTDSRYILQDLTGKIIESGNILNSGTSIDLNDYNSGVYILSLIRIEHTINIKVVVIK